MSTLQVENLIGQTSGSNANKIIIPSGQTLEINSWTPPTGTVLQVVQTVKSDGFSTGNSGSHVDITGFSATITPSSASSKILVLVSAALRSTGSGSGNNFLTFNVYRGSSTLLLDGYAIEGDNGDSSDSRYSVAFNYLDSPNTTSAVTYKGTLRAQFCVTAYMNSTTTPSTITLMEIAQ